MGAISFTLLMLFLVLVGQTDPNIDRWSFNNILVPVSIVAFFATWMASFVVPELIRKVAIAIAQKETNETNSLSQARKIVMNSTIIKFALLEGGTFFCLVSFFLSKNFIPLIAAAIGILTMLIQFPMPDRTQWAVENIEREIKR